MFMCERGETSRIPARSRKFRSLLFNKYASKHFVTTNINNYSSNRKAFRATASRLWFVREIHPYNFTLIPDFAQSVNHSHDGRTSQRQITPHSSQESLRS
jgi:hypothetical protein